MIKRALIVVLAIGLCTGLAGAGSTVWTAGTGNWSNGSNWDNGEPVGGDYGDSAYINNGGAAQITAGNDESCGSFLLGSYTGDSGTIDMTGGNLSVTNYIYVGYEGDGMLNIADGATVGNDGHFTIAAESGSSGAVTVDGDGSTWTNASSLNVGDYGNATLDITAGGAVSTSQDATIGYHSGSTGAVTVSGAGSTLTSVFHLTVGYFGGGTLNIAGGGTVSSPLITCIGGNSGSTGVVTVDGVGSTWMNSGAFLNIGDEGAGTLNITNGGTVINDGADCNIGCRPGSTGIVTVDGAGSTWTCCNSSSLYVGDEGNGTLNITGGGAVINVNDCHIGYESGSTGEVTVDGAGSTWTNTALYVGGDSSRGGGDGALNVTGGGAVSSYRGYVGYDSSSTGVATVDGAGSKWTNSAKLYVGLNSTGTLNITRGGLVSVGDILTIDYDGDGDGFINMAADGMLALWGDADDSLAEFLGLIDGTDAIQYGDIDILDWDAAGLDYQLDYLTGGDLAGYTMLRMNSGWGDFDLDADVDALDIDALADAIRLGLTETMYDLSGAGENGTPDGLIDINDLDFLVHQLVETTAGVGTEYGDFNLDGMVDTTDLTRLSTDYGYGDTWAKGNANRNIDLITDTTDLTILATYYGQGPADPDAIPEPASTGLLLLGASAVLGKRRRK